MTDFITWLAEEFKQILLAILNTVFDGFLFLISYFLFLISYFLFLVNLVPVPDFIVNMPTMVVPVLV